jgi:glycosyltransferase involved in cell wall biosynthesis
MIIGIANNLYPPYGRNSGAEIVAHKMANDLRTAGHEVFIITTKLPGAERSQEKDIYYLNSHYERLSTYNNLQKIIWHLGQLLYPWHHHQLKKIIKERKPSLVITHNLIGLGFYLPRLLAKHQIKHEHILHDIQLLHPSGLMYWGEEKIIDSLLARCYQIGTRWSIQGAKNIISPSQWLLTLHQKKGFFKKQKSEVRLNFQIKRQETKILNKPVAFAFIGQAEKHKGLAILLAAWQKATLNNEEANLTIAGKGSLSPWLEKESTNYSNVSYLDNLDRAGVEQLLNKTDVVVVPSLVYENSPTSLWEAASHGLRGLASDIGGIPELSPFLDLTLVPPGDSTALAAAFKKIVKTN